MSNRPDIFLIYQQNKQKRRKPFDLLLSWAQQGMILTLPLRAGCANKLSYIPLNISDFIYSH
jgi:hypothetical protein